jgi:hypothetical protein
MSIIEQLAVIRERQGLSPLPDPRIIGGPPMAPPPVPENFGEPTATEQDPFDEEEPPSTVSPLVAAGQRRDPPNLELTKETMALMEKMGPAKPVLSLCVFDSEAAYLGHPVVLTDKEKRQVTQIVLKALQRVVKEQLASLVKLSPKRVRRARAATPVPVAEPAAEPVKRKRGRPRGSLLK